MAQAGPTTTTFCPAARVAAQAAREILGFSELDRARAETLHAADRIETLGDVSSHMLAGSDLGAYYQSLVALGHLNMLDDLDFNSFDVVRASRSIRRLLVSISSFLRPAEGDGLAATLSSYYGRADETTLIA